MIFKINKKHLLLLGIDTATFLTVYLFSLLLEFMTQASTFIEDPPRYAVRYALNLVIFYTVVFITRYAAKVYRNVWKYADSRAYLELVFADAIGGSVALILTRLIPGAAVSGWHNVATLAMFNCASLSLRFAYQQYYKLTVRNSASNKDNKISVAIVGAGQIGATLADELMNYKSSHYRPVCFIDNDPEKHGARVAGLPVYKDDKTVFTKLEAIPVQEIFIAIPDLTAERAAHLFEYYSSTGCKVKLYDFVRNTNGAHDEGEKRVIRDFNIEDLLFRDTINVTDTSTHEFYHDKVVLVTGGGGSIGSEIARQVASCHPKRLVIVDIYENNAYDIQQELLRKYGNKLDLVVEIGSVRDKMRLDAIFAYHRPDIVFHAAAHKHVPLMERSTCEAIKNNCFGTYNTADVAEKYGVKKFILISTDKAVNPTNVMGASKRMCEMIIQARNDSKTAFSAVRFGNVLGSNGSVIPLFKRQIAQGGPVTITDKRIIRYFMTIPEAAGLVMQAGAQAVRGELFVLDMGQPVRIYDLALNMIKLSGFTPYVDIDVKEIGLRPGEKLYEELLIKTEDLTKTKNELIFIEKDTPHTREEIEDKLRVLIDAIKETENSVTSDKLVSAMKSVVPTFRSPEEINKDVNKSEEMHNVNEGASLAANN